MARTLPVHPLTGFTALGRRADGSPIWADAPAHRGFEKQEQDDTGATFTLPEELPRDTEELNALRDAAEEAFQKAHAKATNDGANVPSEADLEELVRLGDAVTTIETAAAEVEAEEAARKAKADELVGRVVREKDEAAGEGDDAEDDAEEGDDAEGDDANKDDAEGDDAETDAEKAKADALVAGAAKRPSTRARTSFAGASRAAGRKAADQVNTNGGRGAHPGFALNRHAARGKVPGDGYTDSLGVATLSDDIHPGSTPRGAGGNGSHEVTLATLDRQFPPELVLSEKSTAAEVELAFSLATDESKLKSDQGEGSLLAAGGWCAPSETIYTYLGVPAAGDLADVPELGISRGGVRFPIQPDFGMGFNAPGFLYTEAEAIAQTEDKPCFEIPCDGFDEVRLDAIGLCITAGILQNKGFPEAVKEYIDGILVAHQHRISSYTINKMVSKSGTPIVINADSVISAYDALLNSVELAIIDITTRRRMVYGTTVEIMLPTWARPALRNDLAKRQGVDVDAVTDAMLDAHFVNRKAKVQYVSDWQTGGVGQPGAATPITKLPSTIQFLAYPAGTFFRSQANVIEVGNLYDSAMLKKNRYTALFTEDGIAVGKRGLDARIYTVPLEYTGGVGERLPLAPAAG